MVLGKELLALGPYGVAWTQMHTKLGLPCCTGLCSSKHHRTLSYIEHFYLGVF